MAALTIVHASEATDIIVIGRPLTILHSLFCLVVGHNITALHNWNHVIFAEQPTGL